jgi:hypothetical protein
MRKLLFVAVATTIVALQPTLALAQRQPGSGKESTSPTGPRITSFPEVRILQAIPVTATSGGIPATATGVRGFARCIVGQAGAQGGVTEGTFEHIRFVGNILCLDPGPNGDFLTFAHGCPTGTTPVIQGIKLVKTVPFIPKCPDVYPGATYVQTPMSTGLRTWFPLKHSPCETTFQLEIEFSCVGPDPRSGVRVVREVRVNRFNFRVVITPEVLSWVVHALHNEPLGVCEVPCITDEGLFQLLVDQATTINREFQGGASRIRQLNTAFDAMEATIVANCFFTLSVWQVSGTAPNLVVNPCAIFGGTLPGNFTRITNGFGIVDTLENPCCCKLISDLYWLKFFIIGNDP